MTVQKIFLTAVVFVLTAIANIATAQEPDAEKPDLDDPAVQQGYREGRVDTMPPRISFDEGENYDLVNDSRSNIGTECGLQEFFVFFAGGKAENRHPQV